MAKPGPETMLDKELLAKIEEHVVDGGSLASFAKQSGMSESTLYDWSYKNVSSLNDNMKTWRLMAKLKKAEQRAEEILSLPLQDPDGKIDGSVLRAVQKEAEFIRETLDKENYSKRTENTGKNGKDLIPLGGFNYVRPSDTDNTTSTETAPSVGEAAGSDD